MSFGLGLAGLGVATDAQAHPGPFPQWCPGDNWDPGWGNNWDWNHCHDWRAAPAVGDRGPVGRRLPVVGARVDPVGRRRPRLASLIPQGHAIQTRPADIRRARSRQVLSRGPSMIPSAA